MSAFQQAVLSVAPERLEQFSNEFKKTIRKTHSSSKRKSSTDKSSHSKTKRHRKHSSHVSESKKGSKSSDNKNPVKKPTSKHSGRKRSQGDDRKHRRRKTTLSKDRKHEKIADDSDFDPKDLDLSIRLPPLDDLVKDRKALLDTVFTVIKGPKLTSMLPDILKLTPLEEIKLRCQEQLDVMSSKRIIHVLSGTEMVSSSGTDSSDNEASKKGGVRKVIQGFPTKHDHDHSLQANFIDSTTSDLPPGDSGPSMLFPSALSTARASMANSDFPIKEILNDNSDHDTVSTSTTEPNFIYTEDGHKMEDDRESATSSDKEEGEVQTSEDEMFVVTNDHVEESKTSEKRDADHDMEEVVLVEVEEVEDFDDDHYFTKKIIEKPPSKRRVAIKKVIKEEIQTKSIEVDIIDLDVDSMLEQEIDHPSGKTLDSSKPPMKEGKDQYEGKSQLEVLELKLRARAIRSLMKAAQAGKLKPTGN